MDKQTIRILAYVGLAAVAVGGLAWLYKRYRADATRGESNTGAGVVEDTIDKFGTTFEKARIELWGAGGGDDTLVQIV